MRTIVFGDIHGCIAPFTALLEAAAPDPAQDRIVLLGDLLDRGPDSWAVWQKVMALQEQFGERLVILRGNHESYWLRRKPPFRLRMLHRRVGRKATERSFRVHHADMEEFLNWLQVNVRPYYKGELFQCVHAGILVNPIEANDDNTLIHDHYLVPENRYQGRLTITGHIGLERASWFVGDKRTVKPLLTGISQSLPKNGVICIDTGCGKGGKLTAMIIEGENYRLLESAKEDLSRI